jgi:hypothetical protein
VLKDWNKFKSFCAFVGNPIPFGAPIRIALLVIVFDMIFRGGLILAALMIFTSISFFCAWNIALLASGIVPAVYLMKWKQMELHRGWMLKIVKRNNKIE